jgi:Domain of Unknown Function (DUF928)
MNKLLNKFGFIFITLGMSCVFFDRVPYGLTISSAIAKVKVLLPKPPNRGSTETGIRLNGGSRTFERDPTLGEMRGDEDPNLTAFAPEYQQPTSTASSKPNSLQVWGLTTKEHPTLWVYIPYSSALISRIDFTLRRGDNPANSLAEPLPWRIVYQTSIQPSKQAGIVNFSLPKTSTPLAIDKLYQWEVKLIMKSQPTEEITGWIQRAKINSNLSDLIKRSNPSQQADLYAENGFWYDALSTLAILRRDFPTDPAIKENWQIILKSVNLQGLADRPFVK